MTLLAASETIPIPASHLDLLTRPVCGVLTTMGADGGPQSSLVWVDHDGECARVNTTLERQKGRNLIANQKVSLVVVDPDDTGRFIQIRGDGEMVYDGAVEHLDALTRRYTRHPHFYGGVYPLEQQARETRVICRIHARRITLACQRTTAGGTTVAPRAALAPGAAPTRPRPPRPRVRPPLAAVPVDHRSGRRIRRVRVSYGVTAGSIAHQFRSSSRRNLRRRSSHAEWSAPARPLLTSPLNVRVR